jgi:hypothetical protein
MTAGALESSFLVYIGAGIDVLAVVIVLTIVLGSVGCERIWDCHAPPESCGANQVSQTGALVAVTSIWARRDPGEEEALAFGFAAARAWIDKKPRAVTRRRE